MTVQQDLEHLAAAVGQADLARFADTLRRGQDFALAATVIVFAKGETDFGGFGRHSVML